MVRISEMWHAGIQRVLVAARYEWRNLPRPQFSAQRVLLMAALFSLAVAVIWHCEGNYWVFSCGTVIAGQMAGAAAAMPFGRIVRGAIYGQVIGLLFATFAIIA